MQETYNLYKGNCFEIMDELISKNIKVDMILTDPPYNVTKNKWDCSINLEKLWEYYSKIIKDNGAIVMFGQDKFTAELILSNKKLHRYNLIWEKDRPTGFLNAKRMPLRSHEDICIFYKKLPTYNPIYWEGKPLHSMGNKFKEKIVTNNNYNSYNIHKNHSALRAGDTKKCPRSVLKFKRPHPPIHPTQKPVDLLEYLIKTYTNENDIILDNFMGSGSTGIACINTNRKFIGIELDEKYYHISENRIEESFFNNFNK